MPNSTVADLIRKASGIVGNQEKLAKACGSSQSAVSRALVAGSVDGDFASAIHVATGGRVARWELRPDLFREGDEPPKDFVPSAGRRTRKPGRSGAEQGLPPERPVVNFRMLADGRVHLEVNAAIPAADALRIAAMVLGPDAAGQIGSG